MMLLVRWVVVEDEDDYDFPARPGDVDERLHKLNLVVYKSLLHFQKESKQILLLQNSKRRKYPKS